MEVVQAALCPGLGSLPCDWWLVFDVFLQTELFVEAAGSHLWTQERVSLKLPPTGVLIPQDYTTG